MTAPKLYFAYGSNLDLAQMQRRCPGAAAVGTATLAGHRLVFTGHSRSWNGAVASVIPDPTASVPGVLYACSEQDIATLDRAEGHPGVYRRSTVTVRTADGRELEALIYIKPVGAGAQDTPSADYLGLIRQAYQRLGFDGRHLPEAR